MGTDTKVKIAGVVSSPHRNGNSATLLREALAGAREAGAETEEIFLPEHKLQFCRGCMDCSRTGRCALGDGFEAIRQTLREADGIIISSPTYGSAPCATMKNLLDRLGMFEFMTSSVFGGKYVATIATANNFGADKTAAALAEFACGTVFQRTYLSGTLAAAIDGSTSASKSPEHLAKAQALGRRVVDDRLRGRTYPLQGLTARVSNWFARAAMSKMIAENRETFMRGVYESLAGRGLIA
jgi:multimeric flavodoxin WrbA